MIECGHEAYDLVQLHVLQLSMSSILIGKGGSWYIHNVFLISFLRYVGNMVNQKVHMYLSHVVHV